MSTQPSTDTELDRTEELPQLDVAAYEASLAEAGISSTDTWSVQALRDATLDEESAERPPVSAFRSKAQRATPERPADLTLDAGRILTRVAQLEAELNAAKTLNGELEQRCESLATQIADQHSAVQALQADNARLAEQHSIGLDKVQSLESQLQARGAEFDAELQNLRSSHATASAQSDAARLALERRIAALDEQLAVLNETNASLQEELRAAADLAQARGQEIEELDTRLDEQEDNAAQMARYLATKLVENDALSATLEQRDQGMQMLQTTRDELTEQLQRASAELVKTKERAEAAERDLAATRAEQRERDQARNQETEAKDLEITRLRVQAEGALARVQELETDLRVAGSKQAEQSKQIEEFELQLSDGQRHVGALSAELTRARERITDFERESVDVEEMKSTLDAKRQELDRANGQIAALQSEVEDLGTRLTAQAQQLEAATADLDAAQELAAQAAPAMQELEVALRARDELVGTLRAELQTAQDERSIMAGHLEKARSRNKTLAREVFQRDKRIATLQEDLAVHAETLAAIRQDVNRVGTSQASVHGDEPQRILEAFGHDGVPIFLNRKVITIGRTSDNDACIPSKLVSRHHARLLVGPNAVIVEDAGSTNGCYVNDRLVKQQLMRDGDVLSLGDLRYRLRTVSSQPPRARDNVVSMADTGESE